ncbi:N-acetylglucosamine-6-phosphate deacetylase [Humibacter ginsenosidimutans]|uniref:N-acetylglucosamine-6-phosphate deacetylase n=1 Tax=Humibacter ginsenosidimutans TaxID=2599293 RepID=A0A5B8M3A1_9MICO|nr:N-acetylglucosamine-6-phosphate deacetylase [Humibacter ginsenosidimutans]QDZ14823.1 N-acetylglucosamine-6-phosphate deacetylase [Humibacter ginsenosidimutans]
MSAARVIHSARKLDADGQIDDFWLATDGERIAATGDGTGWRAFAEGAEVTDAGGHWLTPGFIDLHGHGGGGFAYEGGREAILGAIATHRGHGTTRSVLSLVANPIPELCTNLGLIADLADADPLILGSHLEGPFLNEKRKGAHNPEFLRAPNDPEAIEQLIGASRGTLRQITIAPELDGALEAIDVLVEAGVHVAVGHTEATMEQAQAAFDRGARLLTHAFNAMPGIGHRAPGPVIAALDDDRVTLELILDGFHVHPDVAHLAFGEARHRVALITDAMAAAGSADGAYRLGSLDVVVTDGQAWLADGSTIAGSTLTQDTALGIAVERTRVEPAAAVEALTLTPARVLNREHELGRLAAGYLADAVLLDHEWRASSVWAAGSQLI